MSDIHPSDRLWTASARYLERPVLGLVSSQKVLRWAFLQATRATTQLPPGTLQRQADDGSLWLVPPGVTGDAPLILYIHGGGFTLGAPETHAGLAAHLAKAAGMRVVLPPYRLAPEHPFPAAKEDVVAAWNRLRHDGHSPAAICGDSAGGCLALQLAVHLRDAGLPQPAALGLIAPIGDLSADVPDRIRNAPGEHLIPAAWAERIREAYLPDIDPADPSVSPLQGDLSGLPPAMIQAADGEVLAEDARRIAGAMDEAKLDLWPDLPHVWHLRAGRSPAADEAVVRLGRFLSEHAA